MKKKINWDALGISTSLACAIHCVVLPLVVTSLPVLGINIIHNQVFEIIMIGIAVLIGLFALGHSYLKHHRNLLPLVLFSGGILFLAAKQYWHEYELWLLPFAVLFVIIAHFLNWRLGRPAEKSGTSGAKSSIGFPDF